MGKTIGKFYYSESTDTPEELNDGLENNAELMDRSYNTTVQYQPTIKSSKSTKAMFRVDSNEHQVCTGNGTGGYTFLRFTNNQTTTDSSLATSPNDPTTWRITGVLHGVDCNVGYTSISDTFGTWTQADLNTDVASHNGGYNYEYWQSATDSAWCELDVDVPANGYLSVSFLRTGSGSQDVDILSDGILLENISTGGATSVITKEYSVESGSRTIKIQNNALGTTVRFVGLYYSKLKDAIGNHPTSQVGTYVNTSTFDPYVSGTASANNYAIKEFDSGKWGGSLHGGEINILSSFSVDSEVVDLDAYVALTGNTMVVSSSCDIDWTVAVGGVGVLGVFSQHLIGDEGYTLKTQFSGSVDATNFFTMLFGSYLQFTNLTAPSLIDIDSVSQGDYVFPPKCGFLEYGNDKGQNFQIEYTVFRDEITPTDEPLPKVWNSGNHHKAYYAPVSSDSDHIPLSEVFSVSNFRFA